MAAINEDLFAAGRADAAKGLWPHRHEIAQGTVLYRFIDLHRAAPAQAADGPWWFEFEHFQAIRHFAARHGYSLGYAARLFAAILYEWSEVNAVVRAAAKAPLAAWKGRGKPITVATPESDARDRNRTPHGLITERQPLLVSRMTPMQGPLEVYQLYLPGLGKPHRRFDSMLTLLGHETIASG